MGRSKRQLSKAALSVALWCLALVAVLSAKEGATALYSVEAEIYLHDQALHRTAGSLEDWLAGRKSKEALFAALNADTAHLGLPKKLPGAVGQEVGRAEAAIPKAIRAFANQESPDSSGQKALFLELSRYTADRTLALMKWRKQRLANLIAQTSAGKSHNVFRWELAWLDLWIEEAHLTRDLEQAFLLESFDKEAKDILKDFLRLRMRADLIACPPEARELDRSAKERLTVLTRTAEQLARIEKRQSSGAVTRVRRLSRQLSALTKSYQESRLALLKSLI